jgi:hypothetical protein
MVDFSLDEPVDLAYVLLGSLYVQNNTELERHLQSVANALKQGGLYLLDWCVQFDPGALIAGRSESWEMEEHGILVRTTVSWRSVNAVDQTFEERIRLDVNDRGQTFSIDDVSLRRAIYPQEFLLWVRRTGAFEFVGWWNDWNLDLPLAGSEVVNRPIVLLLRT